MADVHEQPAALPSAADEALATGDLLPDLGRQAARGGAVMLGAQSLRFLLQLGATVAFARLLTPEDFGLFAMVLVVSSFLGLFKDFGLSFATIHGSEVSHQQVNALFWLNGAISLGLTAVLVALAPGLAWFYHRPELSWLTVAVAVSFVVGGFCGQHRALLHRRLRFATLARIDLAGLAVGIAVGLALAWVGLGVWALAVRQVLSELVIAAGTWLRCPWRPSRPARAVGTRSLVSFGGYVAGANLMSYGTRNIDSLLVGWQLGAVPLGIYNQAYRLLLMPLLQVTMPLGAVILPTLSRVKDDAARFRSLYRQAVELVAGPGMAVVAVLFCAADEVVRVGLGPQWAESVPIFRVLAIGAWVGTFNQITYWAVISLGEVRRLFRQQLVLAPIYWLSFAVGLHWGLVGVAAAVSLVALAAVPASVVYCFRGTAVGLGDLGRALLAPSLATAVSVTLGSLSSAWLPPSLSLALRLVAIAAVAGGAFAAVWLAFPTSRGRVLGAIRLLRERRVAVVEAELAP